ncbi:competence protein TfoX [Rhodobacteraceae bacterium 2CG4]|uniref:Competence protein TfoX n=1 Tax=Halovulum marinum TaxID=2662447 RepID=A0A6L5Z053_9RHOB|nr:TfoX/Sxy family DNA transformation protein [Halovulum marinum]MSU89868.1 competence protein TfoX [Halovulum marinum]
MARPVDTIRNLGPKSVESFARAGLTSAEQVIALGADEAYRRLLAAGSRPHFIGYYALVMGLQGRPWNDPGPEEKADLRKRFDALVGGMEKGRSEIEAALNALGVIEPRR